MPIDPNTGMYSTQVSYQPTGALGAVTELLNAGKAQDIANTLQQQREAEANLRSSQAQQYAETTQRANQARQAVADFLQKNPNATPGDLANVSAPFEDPTEWTKQYRAYSGLQGRLGAADIAGTHRENVAATNQGLATDNFPAAPKPLAEAANAEAGANLKNTQASLAPGEAEALNNLRNSTAMLARARAQFVKQGGAADQRSLSYVAAMVRANMVSAAQLEKSLAYMTGDETVIADVQAAKDQAAYWTTVLRTKLGSATGNPYSAPPDAAKVAGDLAGGGAAPPVTGTASGLPPGAPPVPNMGHDGKTAKNPLGLDLP